MVTKTELKQRFIKRIREAPFRYNDIFRSETSILLVLPIKESKEVGIAAVGSDTLYYNPDALEGLYKGISEKLYPELDKKYNLKEKGITPEKLFDFFVDFVLIHEASHITHLHTLMGAMKAQRMGTDTAIRENISEDFEINTSILQYIAERNGIPLDIAIDFIKSIALFPDRINNELIIKEGAYISTAGAYAAIWKMFKDYDAGYIENNTIHSLVTHERLLDYIIIEKLRTGTGRGSGEGGAPSVEKGERWGGTDVKVTGEGSIGEIKKKIKDLADKAAKVAKQAGLDPGKELIEIHKLFKGQVNWRELILEEITRNLQEIEYTYAIPHKKSYTIWEITGEPVVYPSIIYEAYPNIIVVIDVSGSTLGNPVISFFSELANLKQQYPEANITLILHDADVQRVVEIPPEQYIDIEYIREVIKPTGGGGTLMKPVIDYIKTKNLDKDCAALIWFTDGFFGDNINEVKNGVDKIACRTKIFALPELESSTEIIEKACTTCKTIYIPLEYIYK